MPQRILPFQFEKEESERGMTSLAVLPTYLDLAHVSGLAKSIREHLNERGQGWTDEEILLSLGRRLRGVLPKTSHFRHSHSYKANAIT